MSELEGFLKNLYTGDILLDLQFLLGAKNCECGAESKK